MISRAILVFLTLVVCGFVGCAGPETRIRKNPELFARLTPEQQTLVKEGKVAVGFDEDMVKLAVGEPDRKWVRTDSSGVSEVWSYTTWESVGGMPLYRGWYHCYYDPAPAYYLNYPNRREHEYFKVVLKDGKVTAVERETR
ncbi:MAG TPA: hypothetical protein VL357_02170 [Rariglobus sp.]|jgi:hypothetical protein|nr:hypothetical protein [Rariglobus sp.]